MNANEVRKIYALLPIPSLHKPKIYFAEKNGKKLYLRKSFIYRHFTKC